jgi:hypothetical protein
MYNKKYDGSMKTKIIMTVLADVFKLEEHQDKCDEFNRTHKVHFNTHNTQINNDGNIVIVSTLSYTELVEENIKPLPRG